MMRTLYIVMFFLGLCIAVQCVRLHTRTEDFFRGLRDDLSGLTTDSNAERVEEVTQNAFVRLVVIKRLFKPIAYTAIVLSLLSVAGLSKPFFRHLW